MIRKLLTLTLIMILSLIFLPQQKATAESEVIIKKSIVKHSIELGVDPALGLSIAKQESGFCHSKRSSYGAVGVFQLMPSTAKRLGYNPYYLSENIRGGLLYYKMMYKMFGSVELALAAYNAGPASVIKYKGVPPYAETRKFVANIMNDYSYRKTNPDYALHQSKTKSSSKKAVSQTYRHKPSPDHDAALSNFLLNQAI